MLVTNEFQNVFSDSTISICSTLGRGAFATVFLCRRQFSRKKFAAKVIHVTDDHHVRKNTENEIQILQELNQCQHVVRMCGIFRDDKTITCLLEYIPGPTFIDGVLNWPRFTENDVITIMKQLMSALAYCHENQVIHRDVSPENLIWSDVPTSRKPNAIPLLKLIDFNLARKMNANCTYIEADPCGNQSYMAPETLHDSPIASFQTDVWSAGVLMFLLLGGYPPFWNDNYNYLVENIIEANYTLPEHLWSHVTISAKDIITRMLHENMEKRPSAKQLLALKWFQQTQRARKVDCIPSPVRLRSFNNWIKKEREKVTHRRYTLTQEERLAYIPPDSVLNTNLEEESATEVVIVKTRHEVKTKKDSSKDKVNKQIISKTNSIQGLVTKYERLSLKSDHNLFVY